MLPLSVDHIHSLTALQELTLDVEPFSSISTAALSGLQQLTLLELGSKVGYHLQIEPAVLACVPQLKRLVIYNAGLAGEEDGTGVTEFLSHLGALQQLAHLELHSMFQQGADARAAVFTALTASSKLEHLELRDVVLPPRTWEYLFPPQQQQQQQRSALREVAVSDCLQPEGVEADDVGMLITCCQDIQRLELVYAPFTVPPADMPRELLRPLVQLSQQLTHLTVNYVDDYDATETLVHLTKLRALKVTTPNSLSELGLLQLTQLQQLTKLKVYLGAADDKKFEFKQQVSDV
jgi:hypothetical protein